MLLNGSDLFYFCILSTVSISLVKKKIAIFLYYYFFILKKADKKVNLMFLNGFLHSLIFKIQKNGVYRLSAFDHYISAFLFAGSPIDAFASELWLAQRHEVTHPLNELLSEGFRHILLDAEGAGPSALLQRSIQLDRQLGCFYFARPQEVTARFFETMLQRAAMKNTFLVSGCVSKSGLPSPYPTAEELAAGSVCWFSYFTGLGRALAL